jgi:signal transduction histidine kinase
MRSLSLKLVLAFLAVSITGTLISGFFAVRITARQVNSFVISQEQSLLVDYLVNYYESQGSWSRIGERFPRLRNPEFPRQSGPPGQPRTQLRGLLLDADGRVVRADFDYAAGSFPPLSVVESGVPLELDGERIGTLVLDPDAAALTVAQRDLLSRITLLLVLGAGGGTLVALLLSVILAQTLTRPLRELTAATRAVARGNLAQEVPVRSQDELGTLAASFNQMSADLSRASAARRQMTADIAHDLRTPLSVILGYAESLKDGVLEATPDVFEVMHAEALQLSRLIEDLRTLSLADAGELSLALESTTSGELLAHAAAAHRAQAAEQRIALVVDVADDAPAMRVDPLRMDQVLTNLVSNALRYTPAGGTITLRAQSHAHGLRMSVSDTGPGIPPDALPHVFDRFFRAESSRRQDDGGASGLGLAIARSIVQAHGGTLRVESPPGSGATFHIDLPDG